ncbi:MAG TPA: DNA helicase PriA [Clostridiales bacterium]|nr:DNA helicase PriA [Clostridiales bacterium]
MASLQYKCLNCKAGLEFYPPTQKWKCHYCFSEFTKEELDEVQQVQDSMDEELPELDSYRCTSCGAELITDKTTSATFCLYCKNPAIIKSRFTGKFKPKYVIPFRLTKEQAVELYKKWIGKHLFAPDEFKHKEEMEKVTGVYAPFWLFDCKTQGSIEGQGTRVRSWTQGEYRYTETRYYRVVRSGSAEYNKVPVDASKKLDDAFMQLIEPYNYQDLTDFSMQYMSGFMAEKYDVESEEAKSAVKKRVEQYTEKRLKETIGGYASYRDTYKSITLQEAQENYALLPVYLLVNKYKGKDHLFIVNGQTGKVVGDAPISRWKQLRFAGLIFAASWLLAVFGGALFGR